MGKSGSDGSFGNEGSGKGPRLGGKGGIVSLGLGTLGDVTLGRDFPPGAFRLSFRLTFTEGASNVGGIGIGSGPNDGGKGGIASFGLGTLGDVTDGKLTLSRPFGRLNRGVPVLTETFGFVNVGGIGIGSGPNDGGNGGILSSGIGIASEILKTSREPRLPTMDLVFVAISRF